MKLIAISTGQDTFGAHEQARQRRDGEPQRRHQRRRKLVERDPARDKGKPQITATKTARQTSAGFIGLGP